MLPVRPIVANRAPSSLQMLAGNSTIERLVIRKADMTETGFTAVISALRERNNTVEDLSVGSQLVRSKEVILIA